ncbi:hypothetical protein GLOIN_2v1883121 [Rhizophagus irregularis DAOM 181602=DAOM 197198]|nr:hypothetical protein GLOIN_2v1883121 [Rhizophagus irregularis DAOM 181602=DAOM 197198]
MSCGLKAIPASSANSVSEKNLVSVCDHFQVGASDDSNSYQHWSLRKVEGVYVSSLEHDFNTNPCQHWIFIKIKNNILYNIANVRNESRSLDEAFGFDTYVVMRHGVKDLDFTSKSKYYNLGEESVIYKWVLYTQIYFLESSNNQTEQQVRTLIDVLFAVVNTFLASPTSKPSPIVITIPPPPPPSSSSAPSSSTKQKSS